MKRYGEVLRVPHVATLIAATLLARFPIGINALALILYLRDETGSFAIAGVVAGGLAAGARHRRAGPGPARRPLRPAARARCRSRSCTPRRSAASSGCRSSARPRRCSPRCSFLAGFAIPPTSSVLRSMWPTLLRGREALLQPAYALDSVMIELIFVLGPLLTAVLAAGVSPASALIVSAVSVVVGTAWFTAPGAERATSSPTARRARAGSARSPRPACAR